LMSSSQNKLSYSEGAALPAEAPEWAISASNRLKEKLRLTGKISNAVPPDDATKVLLHSCCAPCSGAMVEEMVASKGIEKLVVFFYNPNIHPKREYEIRKNENKEYCKRIGIEFIDCDYDVENWYARMKGMEYDPERGGRCTECFDMRMERAALYAHEHGFHAIATTNSTSRWKDSKQVDESGFRAAARYDGVKYWAYDWQSDEMTLRKYQVSETLCNYYYC
jgi:predicted adenine nucleotide alpha hydrolase (AANH) superfamily ATPase